MRSKMQEANMPSTAPPVYEEATEHSLYPTQSMPMPMSMPMNQSMPMPMNQPMPQPMPYEQPLLQQNYNAFVQPPPMQYAAPPVVQVQAYKPPVIFGPHSQFVTCPKCQSEVTTTITYEINLITHAVAFALCFFGCFLCSCIPYCIDSLKNVDHHCPNCKTYLGTYHRRQ